MKANRIESSVPEWRGRKRELLKCLRKKGETGASSYDLAHELSFLHIDEMLEQLADNGLALWRHDPGEFGLTWFVTPKGKESDDVAWPESIEIGR